jgi:outer membrane protein assembly factor BamB
MVFSALLDLTPVQASIGRGTPMISAPRLLRAVNLETGKTVWNASTGKRPGILRVAGVVGAVVVAVEYPCDGESAATAVLGFDGATGRQQWRKSARGAYGLPDRGSSSVNRPLGVSSQGVVWVERASTDEVALRGVNPKTGETLWTQLGKQADSWPLAGNDDVVVLGPHPNLVDVHVEASTATIRALDRRTGEPRWTKSLSTVGARTLSASANDTVAVVNVDNRIWGIDERDGRELWSLELPVPAGAYNAAGVGLAGDVAVVSQDASFATTTSGLNASDGRVLWSGSPDALVQQPKALRRYALFLADPQAGPQSLAGTPPAFTFAAVDAATGRQLWTASSEGPAYGIPPTTTATRAIVPSGRSLAVLDMRTGGEARTITAPTRASSALADRSRLYLAGGCTLDPEQGG